jgi:hypothetical protein
MPTTVKHTSAAVGSQTPNSLTYGAIRAFCKWARGLVPDRVTLTFELTEPVLNCAVGLIDVG